MESFPPKRVKTVNFNEVVKIALIPPRKDYLDFASDLWWTGLEISSFHSSASTELHVFTQEHSVSLKQGMSLLYQPKVEDACPSITLHDQHGGNIQSVVAQNVVIISLPQNENESIRNSPKKQKRNDDLSSIQEKNTDVQKGTYALTAKKDHVNAHVSPVKSNRHLILNSNSTAIAAPIMLNSPISFDKWLRIIDNSFTGGGETTSPTTGNFLDFGTSNKHLVSAQCT